MARSKGSLGRSNAPDGWSICLNLQPSETSKKVVRKQISRKLGDVKRRHWGEADHAKSSPSSILISGHASGLIQSLSVWRLYCGATKQCTCLALRSATQYSRISAALWSASFSPKSNTHSWSQSDQGQSRFRTSLSSKIFPPSLSVTSRILRNRRLGIGG